MTIGALTAYTCHCRLWPALACCAPRRTGHGVPLRCCSHAIEERRDRAIPAGGTKSKRERKRAAAVAVCFACAADRSSQRPRDGKDQTPQGRSPDGCGAQCTRGDERGYDCRGEYARSDCKSACHNMVRRNGTRTGSTIIAPQIQNGSENSVNATGAPARMLPIVQYAMNTSHTTASAPLVMRSTLHASASSSHTCTAQTKHLIPQKSRQHPSRRTKRRWRARTTVRAATFGTRTRDWDCRALWTIGYRKRVVFEPV